MQLYQALITLDGWTFLAQICNLMIQLVIFKKLLLNPVKKVIAERKAKADSQIADAEKLRTEAEAMKAEYEQNLQNARTEANQIVAAAQKTAAARSEELLGEARAQAAALKQKAEADVNAIEENILASFRPAAEEAAPEKTQETAPAEEQSAPKAEEPKAEPLEPDDSPFVETASHAIRLDDLKFGRNYHGEE